MISCVPKFALHDLLMKITHGVSLVRHGGLQFRDRWIMNKRCKIKIVVHGCRISLLVNSHWINMDMEFVLKCPRSKRGNHFHLVLFGSFLVLVFDPRGWIDKHINNKRFTFFFLRNLSLLRSKIMLSLKLILVFSFHVGNKEMNSLQEVDKVQKEISFSFIFYEVLIFSKA